MSITFTTIEDAEPLFRKLGWVPQAEAVTWAEKLAVAMCEKAGLTVTVDRSGAAPAQPAGEVAAVPPTETAPPTGDAPAAPAAKVEPGPVETVKPKAERKPKAAKIEPEKPVEPQSDFAKEAAELEKLPGVISPFDALPAAGTDAFEPTRIVLRALAKVHGLLTCTVLLHAFDATKANTLPVEKFEEFKRVAKLLADADLPSDDAALPAFVAELKGGA